MTDEVGGRIRLLFAEDHADDRAVEGQRLIIHEAAHADRINQPWMSEDNYEPLAYVYQTADAIARQHRLTKGKVVTLSDHQGRCRQPSGPCPAGQARSRSTQTPPPVAPTPTGKGARRHRR